MTGITIPVCRKVVNKKDGTLSYEAIFSRVAASGSKSASIDVTINHASITDDWVLLRIANQEKDWFMEQLKKMPESEKRQLQLQTVDMTL